ncbi:MAG: MerR family transcriptional regulator [Deltaproteobacteria bacterium]|nr:MerR family transcriptional regulator [Deltaproteobacteria bacterium]
MKPTGAEIPDKRYFRIGEASSLTGIEPYVLRYWETEFHQIRPARSRSGQRLYRKQDIEAILEIKELLYTKRYTIAGAKQYLKARRSGKTAQPDVSPEPITLEELRKELVAIRQLLTEP